MSQSESIQTSRMSFVVETRVVGSTIHQLVTDSAGRITEKFIATQDSQIKEALISLGWTPPCGEAPAIEDETKNRWKGVLVDALVCLFLLDEENSKDPKAALNSIVNLEVEMALDPRIGERARQLLEMDPRDYKWD